jgi:hypothetical protein
LNTEIADIVLDLIKNINWMDKYSGLVRPVTVAQQSSNGVVKKTFPIACSVSAENCTPNNYTDLVPNTNYKSVVYFEDGGTQVVGSDSRYIDLRSNLYLIGWLNGKKLGYDGCGISAMAILSIIKTLRPNFNPFNSGSFVKIKINAISEDPKNPNIFTRYSYDESTNQYLMFPFDYFRLNMQISFSVALNCIEDMELLTPQC